MPVKRQPLFQARELKDIKAGVDFVDVDGIFQRYLFPICFVVASKTGNCKHTRTIGNTLRVSKFLRNIFAPAIFLTRPFAFHARRENSLTLV